MSDLKAGDAAIPFCLPDGQNNCVCLEDFKGRWVVLYFYPKNQTPGCSLEAGDFSRRLDDFHGLNAEVIGVSPDSPRSHCSFIEKQHLKLILLSDAGRNVIRKYGVWKLKRRYGRETRGVERGTYLINPRGKVAAVWRGVRVPGHADAVLAEVKKQQAENS